MLRADLKELIARELLDKHSALTARQDALRIQIQEASAELGRIDAELLDIRTAARVLGVPGTPAPPPTPRPPGPPTVRDKTLREMLREILKEQHPKGMKVAALQAEAEKRLGEQFHAKSTGMTLYRLSLKGFVRRDGFDWFYIPAAERANAPEAGDPPAADEAAGGVHNPEN
ncbi:MAG: hypothetical protein AB7P02_11560 [Alphaproteobacteria bacterium]